MGFEDPERICDYCLPVTSLITKSRSLQMSFKLEAAQGLTEMCKEPAQLKKVIEMGGVQTMIFLSQSSHDDVKLWVSEGLRILSTHDPLHPMLAKCGAIKALCSILSSASESQEQTLINGISALMIFCKSEELKAQALADGALYPVLSLCAMKEAIALLAMMTLSHIVEHHGNLAPLIENDRNALPRILALTKANDEKIQEIALRILSQMSMGTDFQRHRIVQEDFSAGRCLVESLRRGPKNLQVLVNGASLIANLAMGEQDQMSLRDCLEAMCQVTSSHSKHKDVQTHVSRALANFAQFHQNSSILIKCLPDIIKVHLMSGNEVIRCHGLRTVIYLLGQQTSQTVDMLSRQGGNDVLTAIGKFPGVTDSVQAALLKIVSPLTPP
ncbi:vacuolar protein 8 isoform X3 [Nematostella vectensis]|nr:vacuolar protein 8 isoform X3 [Nematostella vectensis]